MGNHAKRSTIGHSDADGLSTLLETERELTADLERADTEAAGIVEQARARARELEQAFEATLATELRNLAVAQEAETAATAARITAEARAQVQRLDDVPEEQVRELAAAVLRDFIDTPAASGSHS